MGTCRYVAHFGNGSNMPISDERMEKALREHDKYLEMIGHHPDTAEPHDKYTDGKKVGLMTMDNVQGC